MVWCVSDSIGSFVKHCYNHWSLPASLSTSRHWIASDCIQLLAIHFTLRWVTLRFSHTTNFSFVVQDFSYFSHRLSRSLAVMFTTRKSPNPGLKNESTTTTTDFVAWTGGDTREDRISSARTFSGWILSYVIIAEVIFLFFLSSGCVCFCFVLFCFGVIFDQTKYFFVMQWPTTSRNMLLHFYIISIL